MFKPMLAVNTEADQVKLPVMGSLKLEGVRAIITPAGLFTRPLKKFGNDRFLSIQFKDIIEFCRDTGIYMEGELYCHGMEFNEISSICRRKDHPDTGELILYLFDAYDPSMESWAFAKRASYIRNVAFDLDSYNVKAIAQTMHISAQQIKDEYAKALSEGYEGYVLKDPLGSYKHGRSTLSEQKFLRMKDELTYDGVVVDIIERFTNLCESEENELGMLSKRQDKDLKEPTGLAAVAIVKCNSFPDLIRVTLSRGIKDYQKTPRSASRKEIWENKERYIGKHIRFVGIPVKGQLPRAPRFDDWRTDLD